MGTTMVEIVFLISEGRPHQVLILREVGGKTRINHKVEYGLGVV
jgi:hypothetical protein